MNITVQITADESLQNISVGVSAEGLQPQEVGEVLLRSGESMLQDYVRQALIANGMSAGQAELVAPVRARLLAVELLLKFEMEKFGWVLMDLPHVE